MNTDCVKDDYKCPRCGVYTGTKRGVKMHLTKGPICNPIYTKASREDVLQKLDDYIKRFLEIDIVSLLEQSAKLKDVLEENERLVEENEELIRLNKKYGEIITTSQNTLVPRKPNMVSINGDNNKITINLCVNVQTRIFSFQQDLLNPESELYKSLVAAATKVITTKDSTVCMIDAIDIDQVDIKMHPVY